MIEFAREYLPYIGQAFLLIWGCLALIGIIRDSNRQRQDEYIERAIENRMYRRK